LPKTFTNGTYVNTVEDTATRTDVYISIISITSGTFTGDITPANKIIQTNSFTIPSGITHHQLFCNNTLAGTGSINYDFSADNGSTYDTGQALDTKNTFAGTIGTTAILKINLDGVGSGNTSEASNYALMIWN